MRNHRRLTIPILLGLAALGAAALACSLPRPTCADDSLAAPVLASPADGSSLAQVLPTLTWTYPDSCDPQGYRIDLSTAADFSDTSLSGGTGNPSTSWSPAAPLADCTQYFWRVAAINGTTLGPFSGAWSFRTDFSGACPDPSAPASQGAISGVVWHDLCAIPWETTTETPEGCVALGESSFEADGVRAAGEPGLEGVALDIATGACPGTWLANTTTDADGAYAFESLPPGDYCISVDALLPPNDSLLIPGGWTAPKTVEARAELSIALAPGEAVDDADFGWDFQFLPAPATPTPSPATPTSALGSIGGRIWNDVCHYTGGVAGEPLVLGAGCIGDPNGVWGANGVLDSGEQPMAGVVFRLGMGACPSYGYATTASNSAGYFIFNNLPPGTYCLSLSATYGGNDTRLIPGGPSTHPTVAGEVLITIPLGPGQVRHDILIGWEWQHLG